MGRFEIKWSSLTSRLPTVFLNFKNSFFASLSWQPISVLWIHVFSNLLKDVNKTFKESLFWSLSCLFSPGSIVLFVLGLCIIENMIVDCLFHSKIKSWVATVSIWHRCPLNVHSLISLLSPSTEWDGWLQSPCKWVLSCHLARQNPLTNIFTNTKKTAFFWNAHVHTPVFRVLHTDQLTFLELTVTVSSWKQSPQCTDDGKG